MIVIKKNECLRSGFAITTPPAVKTQIKMKALEGDNGGMKEKNLCEYCSYQCKHEKS